MVRSVNSGRALLSSVFAVWAVWLSGCVNKLEREAVPQVSVAPSVLYDTFTDERDGKKYKTVQICKYEWMAENLNYETLSGSWCYADSDSYCGKYGRLYDWNAAKKACPAGWRLPSRGEWARLSLAVGGVRTSRRINRICLFPLFAPTHYWVWANAGNMLKATTGWKRSGNGTDDYGFAALPGGSRNGYTSVYHYDNPPPRFGGAGYVGHWWTSTRRFFSFAYTQSINGYNVNIFNGDVSGDLIDDYNGKENAYSVRCVMK